MDCQLAQESLVTAAKADIDYPIVLTTTVRIQRIFENCYTNNVSLPIERMRL